MLASGDLASLVWDNVIPEPTDHYTQFPVLL